MRSIDCRQALYPFHFFSYPIYMDRIVVLQNEKGKEISKNMRKGNNDFQPVKIIPRRDKSGEVILIEVKPQKMK